MGDVESQALRSLQLKVHRACGMPRSAGEDTVKPIFYSVFLKNKIRKLQCLQAFTSQTFVVLKKLISALYKEKKIPGWFRLPTFFIHSDKEQSSSHLFAPVHSKRPMWVSCMFSIPSLREHPDNGGWKANRQARQNKDPTHRDFSNVGWWTRNIVSLLLFLQGYRKWSKA